MLACTAYGEIREYDTRQRKVAISVDLFDDNDGKNLFQQKTGKYLSKIFESKTRPGDVVYTVTQEGHPLMLDRRKNYRMLRKMLGAKGSVRDADVVQVGNQKEVVLTVGCDRFLRVFDPTVRIKRQSELCHLYLK